jgi:hypothetical protein
MSQIGERCERKILMDTSQDGEFIYIYMYIILFSATSRCPQKFSKTTQTASLSCFSEHSERICKYTKISLK